jgi:hypothetical protein
MTGSRREFLRRGAFALAAGHPLMTLLDREVASQPLTLKSQAQYLSEAAEFEAAMRDLGSYAAMSVASTAEITRFNGLVAAAAAKIDFHYSWMVATCLGNSSLAAWVRKEIVDQTTFQRFIDSVKRDPKVIGQISGVASLGATLDRMRAEKAALAAQIAAKSEEIAGKEAMAAQQAARAKEASECQKVWAIVAAVVLVVHAAVVAAVTFGATGAILTAGYLTSAANGLAATYQGTGADLAGRELRSAYFRYQQCMNAAASLPPDQRARAIAKCQAVWLTENRAYI